MQTIAELKAARAAADTEMLNLTLAFLKMSPRNPKRIEASRKRDEAVTRWALLGRDLEAAEAKAKAEAKA